MQSWCSVVLSWVTNAVFCYFLCPAFVVTWRAYCRLVCLVGCLTRAKSRFWFCFWGIFVLPGLLQDIQRKSANLLLVAQPRTGSPNFTIWFEHFIDVPISQKGCKFDLNFGFHVDIFRSPPGPFFPESSAPSPVPGEIQGQRDAGGLCQGLPRQGGEWTAEDLRYHPQVAGPGAHP